MDKKRKGLRGLPSMTFVLEALKSEPIPHALAASVAREVLGGLRAKKEVPPPAEIMDEIRGRLKTLHQSRILPVINGTGVLIHTNLGRSPLGERVIKELIAAAKNYHTLEFSLQEGGRGARGAYVEKGLAVLCAAESATVVNNCAAALVLILREFTRPEKPEVIISRGELVQIGGGFRIPEILESSGACLREVGTTNKTTVPDYAKAITRSTALILKVHHSNFYMGGFVEAAPTDAIAALAKKHRIPFVEDLGSGAVVSTRGIPGLEHEPMASELLQRGVDLVCFSGDKLFGGPQAGIIVGKKKLVERLKKNPLFRALRCDKLVLAALQGTVDAYLHAPGGSMPGDVPLFQMMQQGEIQLRPRAEKILSAVAANQSLNASIERGQSKLGGGTLPRSALASICVALNSMIISPQDFAARLQENDPPVIGYISGNQFKLDLRTIFPEQDETVIQAILKLSERGNLDASRVKKYKS